MIHKKMEVYNEVILQNGTKKVTRFFIIAIRGQEMQAVIELCKVQHPGQPWASSAAIASILLAPLIEEIERVVVLVRFVDRFGVAVGIGVTSLLQAVLHEHIGVAIVQQTFLSFVLWKTSRSLPTTMLAHAAINAVAIYMYP